MNLTVADHITEGRQVLARAEKLKAEGTTLSKREAGALRAAQTMTSEALLGETEAVRQHGCPACGCFTLVPRKGRAYCVNRYCAPVGGLQRRWAFRELAFVGPGKSPKVSRSASPPRDVMERDRLVAFFSQSGRPSSAATITRLAKLYNLPSWRHPLKTRSLMYSLSDMATAHAVHTAGNTPDGCANAVQRPGCMGLADLFFTERPTAEQTEAAKGLCAVCPLKAVCLETALEQQNDEGTHGIFGGLTATERRTLKQSGGQS